MAEEDGCLWNLGGLLIPEYLTRRGFDAGEVFGIGSSAPRESPTRRRYWACDCGRSASGDGGELEKGSGDRGVVISQGDDRTKLKNSVPGGEWS
ncbi:hypothetical protein DM860_000305 [Cuscuta australis]|uniref:Uncharacterized protein n=1 Tax=Cuscuta australis TaxID=267555 RepID=A0A328CZ59_9ASTE|nr:hypothetical protein DM860_000305 [Cuscuta australis]